MKTIMFNDRFGLTSDTIVERKTMTRRMIPDRWQQRLSEIYAECNNNYSEFMKNSDVRDIINKARYRIGEIVAIAQSYSELDKLGIRPLTCPMLSYLLRGCSGCYARGKSGCTNKMYVNAVLMPHRIQITNNRIERLQDISLADCLAEGITKHQVRLEYEEPQDVVRYSFFNAESIRKPTVERSYYYYNTAQDAYADLINQISAKNIWRLNPWVFCFSYKLIQ